MVALLGVLGCQRTPELQTPLARVDGETLTFESIRSRFDSSATPSEAQVQEFIQRWITNELLYREAIRQGIDNSEDLTRQLADVKRQLAVSVLLDKVAAKAEATEITEEHVSSYYDAHRKEFVLSNDVALLSLALFRDRESANSFRSTVLRGTPWREALEQIQSNQIDGQALAARVDSVYFTQSTLLPAELWRVASASQRVEPSFPIRTEDGFYCVIVWRFLRQGQTADLLYVQQEIRGRLLMERRHALVDSLLENLRSRYVVEVYVQTPARDTLRSARPNQ